jgi:DNA-binding NtrC family response regulator
MAAGRVLVVDDEKLIRWSVRTRLEQEGHEVREALDLQAARSMLEAEHCDLVLLDYRLPDGTGLELLEGVKGKTPNVVIVMMTAFGTVDTAVQAMKLGAFDFLTKPVNLDELVVVVEKALETSRLRQEVTRLRGEQRASHGVRIVGKSPALREVLELVEKICASQASTVLIEGESGTGKDLLAKAIHYGSPRADKPFVHITCSALAETLLESELFGHERGAFTDARTMKKGLLEVADGGTAFLDEIGEIGPGLQVKLLRFLEDKTFKRVGGTRDIRVDVRIVAATNRVLEDDVRAGSFRADLFYRLKVIPIRLPALRERREDIPLLVEYFLDHYNRELRKSTVEVEPAAMERLVAYDWPGNVRELRNVIERVMILENKPRLEAADLPPLVGSVEATRPAFVAGPGATDGPLRDTATLEELERRAIVDALERAGQNQVRAAKLLGITRDTLRYRMKKFGLLETPG